MNFDFQKELEGLEGGKVVKGFKPTFEHYIDGARFSFDTQGKKQIGLIQSGAAKGNWFEKGADGRYKITLKNGINALELKKGKTFWFLPSAEAACEFIAKAVVAAEAGEFDAYLTATRRAKKAETDKAVDAVVTKVKTNGASKGAAAA